MIPPTPEELSLLGLDPAASLRLVGEEAGADDGLGHGFAGAPSTPLPPEAVRRSLSSVTPIERFDEMAVRLGAPEAGLARADGRRGVYLLAFPGLALSATEGIDPLDHERVAVDASARTVTLRLSGPLGDGVLRFASDQIAWFDILRGASPEMRSLSNWTPPPAPTIPPPDPDALLGGFDAPGWMTASLLADPPRGAYGVCAAVGTLGRLWSPHRTTTLASEAMARLVADDHPWARARRWFDALPTGHRAVVEQLARVECGSLADALDALTDEDRETARVDGLAWLERRDDLASVAALLRTSPDDPLGVALASLDREAGVRATLWRWISPIASPRLEAVAWQSPEAWWGAPAGAA